MKRKASERGRPLIRGCLSVYHVQCLSVPVTLSGQQGMSASWSAIGYETELVIWIPLPDCPSESYPFIGHGLIG